MPNYKDSNLYTQVDSTEVYTSDGSKTSYSGKANRIDDALTYLANNIGSGGASVTIDDALSDTSTNPVQNKVITVALDNKVDITNLATVAISGSYNDLSDKPEMIGNTWRPIMVDDEVKLSDSSSTIEFKSGNNVTLSYTSESNKGSIQFNVPTATANSLGLVRPDGSSIIITNGIISAVNGGGVGAAGTKIVTVTEDDVAKTSLQAITNLTPNYEGNTRGNGAVDLQQGRSSNAKVASGNYATTIGLNNTASKDYAVAIGRGNTASANSAFVCGYNSTASGANSVVIGYANHATEPYSIAIGNSCGVHSSGAIAIGAQNTVNAPGAFAVGYNNRVCYNDSSQQYIDASYSVTMGLSNYNYGDTALVNGYGNWNWNEGKYAAVFGKYNYNNKPGVTCSNVSNHKLIDSTIVNSCGNCGFKGVNLSCSEVSTSVYPGEVYLWEFDSNELFIANIHVICINTGAISEHRIVVKNRQIVTVTNIYPSSGTNLPTFAINNNKLYISNRNSNYEYQVGIFYTYANPLERPVN